MFWITARQRAHFLLTRSQEAELDAIADKEDAAENDGSSTDLEVGSSQECKEALGDRTMIMTSGREADD